jgi:rod shape-determining protein MreC
MKRKPGEDPWYSKPFSAVVSFAQGGYSSFTSGVRGTTSMYLKLIGIKKQNLALQKENEELRATLGALTELKLENERLSKLLDFKQSTSMQLLAAKVIARDLSPDHYSIRINRGTKHGLKKLMGVITVEGVVGYVLRSGPESSQVLVLTDRSSAVDGVVQRTRARGLISGSSLASCRLRYLERADDVSAGDMVVTSGLGGYFPKGFPIGKITSVRKTDFGISQEASVTPVVNPSNLEEVFVVLNSGQEDFTERFGGDQEDEAVGPTAATGSAAPAGAAKTASATSASTAPATHVASATAPAAHKPPTSPTSNIKAPAPSAAATPVPSPAATPATTPKPAASTSAATETRR